MKKFISFAVALTLMIPFLFNKPLSTNALARDPNRDGVINIADSVYVRQYLLGVFDDSSPEMMDMNYSGVITLLDADICLYY